MKLSGIMLMTIAGLIPAVLSCQDCCTTYVHLTDTPSLISDTDECNKSCNITINKLNQHQRYHCKNIEYLVQSGIHYVNESSLSFGHFDSVVIKGEPNATILCWNTAFCLIFNSVPNVTIRDMHIWNCSCNNYHRHGYETGLAKASLSIAEVKILNSKFSNSRLSLNFRQYRYVYRHTCRPMSSIQDAKIIINLKDTIIENCCGSNPQSFLDIKFDKKIIITLENVNFIDNNLPFFSYDHVCVFFTFTGHNNFTRNKATIIGFRLSHSSYFKILFSSAKVYITDNHVRSDWMFGSPFEIENGEIIFEHCHVVFSGNHGSASGGIRMSYGKMVLNDNAHVEFSNNTGQRGGALSLGSSSTMIFNATNSNIVLNFTNNFAQRGGALYMSEKYSDIKSSIFDLQCSAALVTLMFSNNSALFGGNQIYGGWVDWFKDEDGVTRYKPETMKEILNFESNSDSEVASCPTRICLCKNGRPDCSISNTTMEIYGYAISLDLIAVGQRYTPVPAHVQANLKSGESNTKQSEELWHHLWPRTESLQTTCTNIVYKIYSNEETLLLEPSLDDCYNRNFESHIEPKCYSNDSVTAQALVLFQQLSIHLKYKDCPLGFILHKINRNCVCQPFLSSLGLSCDLETTMIHRNKQQWVGVTHEHTTTSYEHPGVIVHQYCPFDYCRMDSDSLLIRLEDQAELCVFNRSGILCGGCATNFSRVLGSSKCRVCSTDFKLFAIILGWLLSGLMLVVFLMLLDLTVSVGTINGLTFYANIIQAQHVSFFTSDFSSSFLCKFIAWLNLDQGIETCLYNGLDDYTITWLQFLFPLYIWLIAAALIVISHYSTRISKLIGRNAIQVLATLFLITYAKQLRLIIEVFSFTTLTYPDGYKKIVWLVDGNVDFFQGRHIPLVLVTVIFILLSLPYTFVLLTIQFLYKISYYRVMFWVQRLKPFFDAYTGPYRANHRYWTGLLLVARIILLVIFSVNHSNDTSINLLAIILVSVGLLGWLAFGGWVYEHPLNNFLEATFLCNLVITSAVVLFGKGNTVAVQISTIVTLIILTGIIFYHVQKRLLLTKFGSEFKKRISTYIVSKRKEVDGNGYEWRQSRPISYSECQRNVTFTTIELKEPLLEVEPEQ